MLRQLTSFATVGALGAGIQYLVLIGLTETAIASPMTASAIGFILGATVNYTLNKRITFRSDRRHREAAPRFLAVASLGLFLNTLFMYLLMAHFHIVYPIAQILATGIVVVSNYLANRHWTFRASSC